jgi:hypothetical protein
VNVHMSDWIKVRAAGIRSAEDERKAERNRQMDATKALKARVEPFWNELVGVLQDSVKEFNSEFPETERQIDHFERSSATSVTIRRSAYPAALVRVQLNNGGNSAHYSISRTEKKGTEPVEKQGSFVFSFVDGRVGYLEGDVVNHEDVAKLFLEPFFQF